MHLKTFTDFIPNPVKDIILAPFAARENAKQAADRLIKASIRITIAALGIFSIYKSMSVSNPTSALSMIGSFVIPFACVYLSSKPAVNIMLGFGWLSIGTINLITTLSLEALNIYSLSLNLLALTMCMGLMSLGLWIIHQSDERINNQNFPGYFELYISLAAEKYRSSVANFLTKF